MHRRHRAHGISIVVAVLAIAACSPAGGAGSAPEPSASGGTGASVAGGGGNAGSEGLGGLVNLGGGYGGVCTSGCAPAVCGDGAIGDEELCDDANTDAGDGCDAACQLEPGWLCPAAGRRCVARECGDGLRVGTEQCDDGDVATSDGCSAACRLEPGFACSTTSSPTTCHATTCGDGTQEGFEQCDDGNLIPYDACSPTCTIEPECADGACTAVCGDGLVFPQEACDDGNVTSGDGCSASCVEEDGFTCETITLAAPDALTIPILYRDFLYSGTTVPGPGHPDFESTGEAATGLVEDTLGSDGKPVFKSSTGSGTVVSITDAQSFYWWYHDEQCSPTCTPSPYGKLVHLDASNAPTTLTLARQANGSYVYSSSAFFPVNGLGWGTAQTFLGSNFSFTSELRYQFTHTGGEVLTFAGDDDVYVFINGRLAVDLGGLHGPETGTITLDAATASNLGLTVGGMYEIALFQAERHTFGSNYVLTLNGFVRAVTECESVCGDGIVTQDELCDDGEQAGSYGSCAADCQSRAAYCGDGVLDEAGGEQCDGTPSCSPACQIVVPR